MSILNVVQPEEFDPSSFTLIDDKLHVAISAKEDNILQYKNDGLYAPTSGGGVLERYVYNPDSTGKLVHKDVEFMFDIVDGAIQANIYGTTASTEFSSDDVRYSTNNDQRAMTDDAKYYLSLDWGAEYIQRSILKFQHNGETAIWVVRVARPFDNNLLVVIDEMVDTGDLSGEPPGDLVYPGLTETTTLKHVGVIPAEGDGVSRTLSLFDNDCFAIVELDAEGQPVIGSPANLTGRLAVPHEVDNLSRYLSYCPNSGAVIYRHGGGIEAIIDGERFGLNLPLSNEGDATIGATMGTEDNGNILLFLYTFSAEGLYYQTYGVAGLSGQKWNAYPDIEIYDYVVSGFMAYYLGVKDGSYVLYSINLNNNEVLTTTLVDFDDSDTEVNLIPTALGGVLVHLNRNGTRVIIPYLSKRNAASVELNLGAPVNLEGSLLKLDRIYNAGFVLFSDVAFKFFVNSASLTLNRLTADFATGEFSILEGPIPADYLTALMDGSQTVPLSYGLDTVGYDKSPSGEVLTYESLTLGAVSKVYQTEALFKFNNAAATLAFSSSGDLGLFSVNGEGAVNTEVNLLPPAYTTCLSNSVTASHLLGVAFWKSKEGKDVFARFSETTNDVTIVELGVTSVNNSTITISQDADGNYLVKEAPANDGQNINVWSVSSDNVATLHNHANVSLEGTTTFGTTLLGDKLLVLGYVGNTTSIRVLNARTGDVVTQANIGIVKNYSDLSFQQVDNETLAVIENLKDTNSMPTNIKVTLLNITASGITVVKKSTLAMSGWLPLNGSYLNSLTYKTADGTASYQSGMRDGKRYYVKVVATATGFSVYEQEITSDILSLAEILIISEDMVNGVEVWVPMVTLINGDKGYIQHDLKLSSFNTFTLDMVEHDNSPKPKTFTATWSQSNGQILLNGQMANAYTDNWTYIRLEVDTPSGETHETKGRIGSNKNGVFTDSLWTFAEPGEYVFRVSHWDGGPVMEARASVPNDGRDFTPPTVTPESDGKWVFSSTNAQAASRGVYLVHRSRTPISILDDFDNDSRYINRNIHTELKTYSIPSEERNGVWYIMVEHSGSAQGDISIPTFFTYGI